jgi:hypothetical protein
MVGGVRREVFDETHHVIRTLAERDGLIAEHLRAVLGGGAVFEGERGGRSTGKEGGKNDRRVGRNIGTLVVKNAKARVIDPGDDDPWRSARGGGRESLVLAVNGVLAVISDEAEVIGGGRFQWASAPADRDRAAGRDVGLEGIRVRLTRK